MIALLRRPEVSALWLAGLLSLTGDWALRAALPVVVYLMTGSTLALGAVFVAGIVPRLVLGSFAGVFVDRWNRRTTLRWGYALQGIGTLPLVVVSGADHVWIVAAVAAFGAAVSVFSTPAEHALLPRLVGSDRLVPANALNALNNQLARLAGPALGGVAVATLGLGPVVVADAASFLAAAVLVSVVPAAAGVPERAEAGPQTARMLERARGVITEWRAGAATIAGTPQLRILVGFLVLTGFTEGVFGTLLVPFVTDVLRGSAVDFGIALASQAIGGVAGSIAVGRYGRDVPAQLLVGVGAAWIGLVDLLIFSYPVVFPAVGPALVLFAIVGFTAPAIGVGVGTWLQQLVSDAQRGRVFATQDLVASLALLAGGVAAGAVGDRAPILPVIALQAAGYGVGGLGVLVWTRGKVRSGGQATAPGVGRLDAVHRPGAADDGGGVDVRDSAHAAGS